MRLGPVGVAAGPRCWGGVVEVGVVAVVCLVARSAFLGHSWAVSGGQTKLPILLVVDDELDVTEVLKDTFSETYEVVVASSAWAALQEMKDRPIAAMITDQRMPGMTGVELCRRSLVERPSMPCIILTGYTSPMDLVQALHLENVFKCVSKPWDLAELTRTLEQAIAHGARKGRR